MILDVVLEEDFPREREISLYLHRFLLLVSATVHAQMHLAAQAPLFTGSPSLLAAN